MNEAHQNEMKMVLKHFFPIVLRYSGYWVQFKLVIINGSEFTSLNHVFGEFIAFFIGIFLCKMNLQIDILQGLFP